MSTANTNDELRAVDAAVAGSRSDYCNATAAAYGRRVFSRQHGELFFSGCERHPDRLDLSCARIRRVKDGLPLTTADVWAVLSENTQAEP